MDTKKIQFFKRCHYITFTYGEIFLPTGDNFRLHFFQIICRVEPAVIDNRCLDAEIVFCDLVRPATAKTPAHRGETILLHPLVTLGHLILSSSVPEPECARAGEPARSRVVSRLQRPLRRAWPAGRGVAELWRE